MKNIALVLITGALLSACSTVQQADTDFKSFCKTVENCNQPNKGWHINCKYCAATAKCRVSACPNKTSE